MNKLAATLLSLAALAAIPASANAQSSTTVRITNQNSNKALTASGGSVTQATFTGRTAQKWDMFSVGNVGGSKVAFRYRSRSTGHCLDIDGRSGRAVVLRPCSTTKFSQQWVRDFAQNTTFLASVNRSAAWRCRSATAPSSAARRSSRSSTPAGRTRSGASSASEDGPGMKPTARGVVMGGRQERPQERSMTQRRHRAARRLLTGGVLAAGLIAATTATAHAAVTASFANGALTVTGDNLDNNVAVSRNAAGQILVNGGAVAVIGGTPTVANTAAIKVFGLGGNDVLTLSEVNGALPRRTSSAAAATTC